MSELKEEKLNGVLGDWISGFGSTHPIGSKTPNIQKCSLVNHQTSDIWKHLARHVRPPEEAWKIKKNLEIKNQSMPKRKLELKQSINALRSEISLLKGANGEMKKKINEKQLKLISKDSEVHSEKAKNLAFSRDVNLLKIHRSQCAKTAEQIGSLTNTIAVMQERISPTCSESDVQLNLPAKVDRLHQNYQNVFLAPAPVTDAQLEGLHGDVTDLIETYPHACITEVLYSLAKQQLADADSYQRALKEELHRHSASSNPQGFDHDLHQLSTKVVGFWTLLRDLEERVIPSLKYKISNAKDELSEKLKEKLLISDAASENYVRVGGQLAAIRAAVEYLRGELVERSPIPGSSDDDLEEVASRIHKAEEDIVTVGNQLFNYINLSSSLTDSIASQNSDIPTMSDHSKPSELWKSMVKEIEEILAAFSELDKQESTKNSTKVLNFSLPVFQVLTESKTVDMLLEMKNLQDFLRSSRLTFEAKRALLAKHDTSLDRVKEQLTKISSTKEATSQSLLPRLEGQLGKTKEEKKILGRCETAINNWVEQPAQDAILPQRTVDDLSFQDWKTKLKIT